MAIKRLSMFVLAALLLVGTISQVSEAQTTHIVGDSTGWTIPSGGAATYTTWASQQNFSVGDILVFNFVTGSHDVTEVSEINYGSCISANPISSTASGPASITLSSSGKHYFVCGFPGHCDAGQKLTVTVSGASTATPPSSTATPSTSPAMPPSTPATPPSTTATPSASPAMPPSTTATPPSTTATPPSTTATPPSTTTATPPSSTISPPSGSTAPSTKSPSGSATPPSPSSATALTVAALPVALLSFALAFLH